MKKVNEVVYNKLILQAEEAKEQNLTKLAGHILGALTATSETESVTYSSGELKNDIQQGLWKLATNLIKYHDLDSVDAEKIDETIEALAEQFIDELEVSLGVEHPVGKLEPKLLGQK